MLNSLMEDKSRIDVAIVGGGPVGLWTAIQLAVLRPDCKIVIFERHEKYMRSHLLLLEQDSFGGSPRDERLQEFTESLPHAVKTNYLEEKLLKLAKEFDITIKYIKITERDQILQLAGSAKAIVGADGARSFIRREFFGDIFRVQDCLKCIVDLKYEVEGAGQVLPFYSHTYPLLKKLPFLAEEHVGKLSETTNSTPITFRSVISESVYDEFLKEATFANPYQFPKDFNKLGPTFKRQISMWLNAKSHFTNEHRIPNSEKMTAVKLAVYQAQKVSMKYQDKKIFLVGDAAFGVPFFRSLNNGLICSSKLAYCLADLFPEQRSQQGFGVDFLLHPNLTSIYKQYYRQKVNLKHATDVLVSNDKTYKNFVNSVASSEISMARIKSQAMGIIKQGIKLSESLPETVQIHKLSKEDIKIITDESTVFPSTKDLTETETATDNNNQQSATFSIDPYTSTINDLGADWNNETKSKLEHEINEIQSDMDLTQPINPLKGDKYMNQDHITMMSTDNISEVASVIGLSNLTDPFFEYLIPNNPEKLTAVTWFCEFVLRYSAKYGRTFVRTSDHNPFQLVGAAIWQDPKEQGTSVSRMLKAGAVDFPKYFGIKGMMKALEQLDYTEQMMRKHVPEKHWGLFAIGILPELQRRGYGSQLLQPILKLSDETQKVCAFYTAIEECIPFFSRWGFKVIAELPGKHSGPKFWIMRRDPI